MDDEMVDIVDNDDAVLYSIRKVEAHEQGLLHRTVIAGIFDSQGRWVFARQSPTRQDAGQLVSPVGGHVQAGETIENALKREALEETGLADFDFSYVGKIIYDRRVLGRHENHYFVYFRITSDHEPVGNEESVGFERFTEAQLRQEIAERPERFGAAFYAIIDAFYPQLRH